MIDIVPINLIQEELLRTVDTTTLEYKDLYASIKEHGILVPLDVVEKDGMYRIADGLKRLHILKSLGIKEVPVNIKVITEQDVAEMELIAGKQKVRTLPCEYARAIKRLLSMNKMSYEELATKLDKTPDWVRRKLKLNDLIDGAMALVDDFKINETNAYNLARLSPKRQKRFLRLAETLGCGEFEHIVRVELKRK